jgi:hypothetical protein
MLRLICAASAVAILAVVCCNAQSTPTVSDRDPLENPYGNVHLGFPVAIPLNPAARAVHLGFGLSVGGGYNFNRNHGLVGDFLWSNLLPTNEALAKLRTALQDPTLDAKVSITEVSGNYRYEIRGQRLGTYFIGGAGLFYRHTSISKETITGNTIQCDRTWEWWGFTCTSGTVTENQTVGAWSSTGPGFNGGIGFTVRVGDPPYRFYTESRYHYAPNSQINTQLIEITFGIRY